MGNLRQSMTDEEWNNLEEQIITDRRNGKPDEILIHLSVWTKSESELLQIRQALSPFYSDYELKLIDDYIKWKR